MDPAGRTALVTGGARRIGKAIALALTEAGAKVVIHAHRSLDEAEAVADACRELPQCQGAVILPGDLSVPAECDALADAAEDAGPIDILVNNAAVYPKTPLQQLTAEHWDDVQAVNLRAPVLLAQRLGLAMRERGRGVILNLTDWGTDRPHTHSLAYAAAKAGLQAATAGLARALAPQVRVNSIAPGAILPPEDASSDYDTAVRKATPLGRWGGVDSVTSTVLFLIGNDFATGGNYLVDGGRSTR